jgi:hypothetical protein
MQSDCLYLVAHALCAVNSRFISCGIAAGDDPPYPISPAFCARPRGRGMADDDDPRSAFCRAMGAVMGGVMGGDMGGAARSRVRALSQECVAPHATLLRVRDV